VGLMNQDMYGVVKPMMKGGHAILAGPIAGPFAAIPTLPFPIPILLPAPPLPVPIPVPMASQSPQPVMSGGSRSSRQRKRTHKTTPVW
jgi:hypothetical protein